jgi:hypothetical protein
VSSGVERGARRSNRHARASRSARRASARHTRGRCDRRAQSSTRWGQPSNLGLGGTTKSPGSPTRALGNATTGYAWEWVRRTDTNGHLQMTGSRTLRSPLDSKRRQYTNTPSPSAPTGMARSRRFAPSVQPTRRGGRRRPRNRVCRSLLHSARPLPPTLLLGRPATLCLEEIVELPRVLHGHLDVE